MNVKLCQNRAKCLCFYVKIMLKKYINKNLKSLGEYLHLALPLRPDSLLRAEQSLHLGQGVVVRYVELPLLSRHLEQIAVKKRLHLLTGSTVDRGSVQTRVSNGFMTMVIFSDCSHFPNHMTAVFW